MPTEKPPLHVVFGRSAAGTLQQALELAGREGAVVAPYDDFSFGPIDTDDAGARARCVQKELGCSGWQQIFEDSLPVLNASKEAGGSPIAWVSPDSAHSVAGFLWWLSHMQGRECFVPDVPRLSLLDPDSMGKFLDRAEILPRERRASSLALWAKLQAENAPLRVLGEDGLMSAPMEYFDETLFAHVTLEWQKMARIVGGALCDFSEAGIFQTGDLVLAARLADLAKAGRLEWCGDLGHMANCEMRRLTPRPKALLPLVRI